MVGGGPLPPVAGQRVVEDFVPSSGNLQANNVRDTATRHDPAGFCSGLCSISKTTNSESRFFSPLPQITPAVDLYDRVHPGDLIGTVSDLFGEVVHECRAVQAGVVICIRHFARVEPTDALATLAPDAGEPEAEL